MQYKFIKKYNLRLDIVRIKLLRQIIVRQMMQIPVADFDFYQRKIRRLESDLCTLQDELTNARLRLRTAEDFQIKYQLLLQKTQQENDKLRAQETQLNDTHQELLSLKIAEKQDQFTRTLNRREKQLMETYEEELRKAKKQLELIKQKHEKAEQKGSDLDLIILKNKKLQRENEILEEKVDELKRESQSIRNGQIEKVKQSLFQKNKQRQQSQRKMYRDQIDEFEAKIQSLEAQLCEALSKVNPEKQKEIQRIKIELQQKAKEANAELQKISRTINDKNTRINEILAERQRIETDLQDQKRELRNYIKVLEDKLFQKETQYQSQLIDLKQRMKKAREEQAQELLSQMKKSEENFQRERESWNTILQDKDKQIDRIKLKAEQDSQRYKEDKESKKGKIQRLKERLREYQGDKHAGQTQNLLKSLKDLENKQADFANYENGVTFLDRQLKRATLKLEQKNIEVSKLIKELNDYRTQTEKEIDDLKQKIKKEKKYYTSKINGLQSDIRELSNQIRLKDKQIKKKDKDTESEAYQLKAENKGLKDVIQEMERDYKRIIDSKKELQKQFREEREKVLVSQSDLTMAKKQKWLELERQKNQIQVIYKEKQQRLKTKYEIQKQKLRHERDNLQKQNQIQKGLIEQLQKDKEDREDGGQQNKYSELNKKVATLDLEIALAQNIYDCLKEAKCRFREQSQRQIDKISERQSEGVEDKQFEVNPPENEMVVSFNPQQ